MTEPAPAEPILPAHIEETIEKIARLHIDHRRGATGLQKAVEQLTRFFSRPRAAGLLAISLTFWIGANLALSATGRTAFDPAPFNGLQSLSGILGLFISIFILITQRREDELSELREQLTLELAMLSEQKTAKVIELLEELRRDLPIVSNRRDLEAEALAQPADPEAVLEALKDNQTLNDAPSEA